jgi:phospholipase C
LALVTGDAVPFYNGQGQFGVPPTSFTYQGVQTSQVENPNPQTGLSNPNWYTEDGYRGGSYVNCADPTQPGVKPITDYLTTLSVKSNCAANAYYLLNNYNLGYKADGTLSNPTNDPTLFTLPPIPATLPNIGDALSALEILFRGPR